MIVLDLPPLAEDELARAVAAFIHRRGEERVQPALLDFRDLLLAAVRRQAMPAAAIDVDEPALLTFTEASNRLGVSTRTVSRMVERGELSKQGQRLVVAEVERIAAGRNRG